MAGVALAMTCLSLGDVQGSTKCYAGHMSRWEDEVGVSRFRDRREQMSCAYGLRLCDEDHVWRACGCDPSAIGPPGDPGDRGPCCLRRRVVQLLDGPLDMCLRVEVGVDSSFMC